ncbi:MAG TPA: hypothetical protein VF250_14990 [Conexibacter sp.]
MAQIPAILLEETRLAKFVANGALTEEQAVILGRLSPEQIDWSAAPPLRAVPEHTRFAVERALVSAFDFRARARQRA